MKTKTLEPKAAQLRRERLNRLIVACREKFSDEEIIEAFAKETFTKIFTDNDEGEMVEYLKAQDSYMEEAIDYLERKDYKVIKDENLVIFKPMYGYQETQLREYAENVVFPYYSDQQACIL